jgi:GT2 family glycosyltransferase
MPKPLVSVCVVNYHAAHLLKDLLDSLFTQGVDLEVLLVDNSASEAERARLERLPHRVHLVLNPGNLGFAKGCAQAFGRSRGEWVLFLNPDTSLFPGALERMIAFLDRRREGVVSPRAYLDKGKALQIVPSSLHGPSGELWGLFREKFPWGERRQIRKRITRCLAQQPQEVRFIPGAHLMAHRSAFERVGLFDEAYPLYFEDTDWCLRARQRGYRLYVLPDAEIVHYYNQSAKTDAAAQRKYALSREIYQRKHHSLLYRKASACVFRALRGLPGKAWTFEPLQSPVGTAVHAPARSVVEFSPQPSFVPSAIGIVSGEGFRFPSEVYEHLAPGRHYLRTLHPGGVVARWCFDKA